MGGLLTILGAKSREALTGATLVALITNANAATDSAIPFLPKEFTIICESEKSIGFDWKSGNWHGSQYKPNKRIITKSEDNDCDLDEHRGPRLIQRLSSPATIASTFATLVSLMKNICRTIVLYFIPSRIVGILKSPVTIRR
jgi:hypothetical protein